MASAETVKQLLNQVKDISDNQFGDEYISMDMLAEAVVPNGSQHLLVIVERDGDVKCYRAPHTFDEAVDETNLDNCPVLGFCIYAVHSQQSIRQYLNIDESEYPDELAEADRIGTARSIAVREEYQNEGYGKDLLDACLGILDTGSCDLLCVVSWKRTDASNLQERIEENGFTSVKRVERYWYSESVDEGYRCRECGKPPCECTAEVSLRR